MNNERIKAYIDGLDGITYAEWKKISFAIDRAFDIKKGELDRDIKLSAKDDNDCRLIRMQLE